MGNSAFRAAYDYRAAPCNEPPPSTSNASCCEVQPAQAPPAALHERCLSFQDLEGLLQTSDLCSAATHALLISLRLCNASVFQFGVVFVDGRQLCVGSIAVGGHLGNACIKVCVLLGLVLDVLLLGCLGDLILLRSLVVGLLRIGLCHLCLSEVLGEVCLYHLQDADDAAAGSRGTLVRLGFRRF